MPYEEYSPEMPITKSGLSRPLANASPTIRRLKTWAAGWSSVLMKHGPIEGIGAKLSTRPIRWVFRADEARPH